MCYEDLDETITVYIGSLPLPEPWATLGTAMNNFNSSHKKVFEHYSTLGN